MSLPLVNPSALVDAGNLTQLQQAAAAHNPQALREAAQQFESLFTSMVLKSMRQADFGDPLFGSDQENLYQDMYDDQIAAEISKGRGLGLADMLVQQLRRESGAAAQQASPAAAGGSGNGSPGSTVQIGASGAASSSAAGAAGPSTAACASSAQQAAFAGALWPDAQQAARQLGVSPVSLIAQAALETDWGRSVPRNATGGTSNNLFGIKAGDGWSGGAVQSGTTEYTGGTATAVKAEFRAYATPGQCLEDYVSLLQGNPRYAAALGTGDNVRAFAAALQQGGYATDPAYASKLGAVADSLARTLAQSPSGAAALKSAATVPTTSGTNTL